ncbi:EAL and HDOD domain-containing protein [Actinoplanes sp. NPDC049265]|uniref:EAL and HDOD domain-containing protein n=1 Tax=Actinoplanes sp. NPDC049265 TaxID=3363902 RepID=UPI00371F3DC0
MIPPPVPSLSPGTRLVHVARQPIFDAAGDVVAYELLFRGRMDAIDADRRDAYATSQVILNAFAEFGVDEVVGDRTCFINVTREFLVGELILPFGPEGVVLEVLESITVDDEVVAGVTALAEAGYRIALDDFEIGTAHERLLPLASYVKLDLLKSDPAEVEEAVRRSRAYPGIVLVAEGLETGEQLALTNRLGVELRQGYVLSRPQVLTATALTPSRMRSLQLLGALSGADGDLDKVLEIIAADPALTLRLLRATNSAAVGMPGRVSSVRQAVVLVGLAQVRRWAMLMAVEEASDATPAQMGDALTRARLCENIAPSFTVSPDAAFMAGLISAVAQLLGTTPAALAHQLPLSPEIGTALTRGTGALGQVLRVVSAYEHGDLTEAATAYRGEDLVGSVMAAMRWSTMTLGAAL